MTYRDVYIAERTMELRVEERLQKAQARYLQRELRPPRLSWLSRQGRLFVCELGYLLVVIGAWLEQVSMPQTQRLERGARSGNQIG